MVTIAEAFDLARTGRGEAAANALKQELLRLQSSDQKIELCEWIATCFENLNDYDQAAEWYEMAGALALSETGSPLANALMAIIEYEKALACREQGDDQEMVDECERIISELKHAYAAS